MAYTATRRRAHDCISHIALPSMLYLLHNYAQHAPVILKASNAHTHFLFSEEYLHVGLSQSEDYNHIQFY